MSCTLSCLKYIYRNEPKLAERLAADAAIEKVSKNFHLELAQNNKHLFDLNLEDEEYGLVVNKPVFVNGLNGTKEYLDQLVSLEGVVPEIEREGSIETEGICGPVDLYSLSFDTERKLRIYICIYGLKNSTVAPRGLKLRDKARAHRWRCDGCNKMRTQTPCEHCGKE